MTSDSILTTVKQMLGITSEYTAFDATIIADINSAFAVLRQLGVGKSDFSIKGYDESWGDFLDTESDSNIAEVKTYVYLKVRMLFDPPANGTIAQTFKESISEFEWRLNAEADDYEHLGSKEIDWSDVLKDKQESGIWPKDGDVNE